LPIESALTVNRRPPTIDIVGISDAEADEVNALFQGVLSPLPYYNSAAKRGELAKYTSDRLREWIAIDPDSVLVAKVAGRLAGFCFSHTDDETIWLSWFGVDPNYRRQGLGSALLERLDARAHKLNSHKIWCDSRTDNQTSAALLRRHGFTQIFTLKRHWYRQDFFIWEKYVG
jgi:ribosomal protein S18 acetylase RimI-like enzyme